MASCWLYTIRVDTTSINMPQIQCERLCRQADRHKLWFSMRVPWGKTKQMYLLLRMQNLNSESWTVLYNEAVPTLWHTVQLVFSTLIRQGVDVVWYSGLVAGLAPHSTLPFWALYIKWCHPSALFTLKVQTVINAKTLKQLQHMMWLGNNSWSHTSHTGCENLRTRTSEVIYYQWHKQKTPHVALSHLHQLSLKHKWWWWWWWWEKTKYVDNDTELLTAATQLS